jgi:UDP-N-acetylglucosamine 2-epimerase (non-hydrolysing)
VGESVLTERPETLEVGSNTLVETKPEKILEKVRIMLSRENNWKNPFEDGNTGRRIVGIIQDKI